MYGAQIFSVILGDLPQLHWSNTIVSNAVPADLLSMRGVYAGFYSLFAALEMMSQINTSKQK